MDISKLSKEEKAELLRKLKEEEKTESIQRKETYEALRHQFMFDVESKLMPVVNDVQGFYDWIVGESKAFRNVMREYGQLRMRQGEETATFSVVDGNFKLEVKSNKVKSFDERADLAAERLIDYLKNYIAHSEKGVDDPMYQMAMTLLERNRQGIWTISLSANYMNWSHVLMKNMPLSCNCLKKVMSCIKLQLITISISVTRTEYGVVLNLHSVDYDYSS